MEGRGSAMSRLVVLVSLVVCVAGSIRDNELDGGERVVFVAPVLAPPRDARSQVTDRARQFPILILLARSEQDLPRAEPEPKLLRGTFASEPIYVKVGTLSIGF